MKTETAKRRRLSALSAWRAPVTGLIGALALVGIVLAAGSGFEAVDDRGQTIALSRAPERVVVLGAFYAQMLVDLGADGLVVGLGDSPDNPPELRSVASVGPAYAPSVELILSCAPDLVLGATDWNGDRGALEAAGVPVYSAPWFVSVESLFDAVTRVGTVLGKAREAEALVGRVRGAMDEAMAGAGAAQTASTRVAYVYAQPGGTLYAMGKGTPEDDLLTKAGVRNAFSEVEGYTQISIEALVARDPAFIVTDPTQIGIFLDHPVLSTLTAVVSGRVVGVPARLVASTRIHEAFRTIVNAIAGRRTG